MLPGARRRFLNKMLCWGTIIRKIGGVSEGHLQRTLNMWHPLTSVVIGYWTVSLGHCDLQTACDLGVGGPAFDPHLWL